MPIVGAQRGPRFQRGGAIDDARGIYIEREADTALINALEAGDYCLVFAPRQVGKSSLRVRAATRLREQGVRTAFVDLSAVGAEARAEDWYFSVAREIAASLGLAGEVTGFWDELGERETAALQLRRFMSEVVLARVDGPVVVFVDETDVTLSLSFSRDDFFAAIRAMFNLRAEDPQWRRLSFCLLGVMTRDDLVADWERTPFNIECKEIRLLDFSRAELDGFAPGLDLVEGDTATILDAVHGWTAGHPALSQRLLWAAVDRGIQPGHEQATVDALVHELFLDRGRELDPVLGDTARRFGRRRRDPLIPRMLEIYRHLLAGERVRADGRALGPGGLEILARLRVAGLVGEDARGNLTVRSEIVAQVFDRTWAHSVVTDRQLTDDLRRWLDGGRNPAELLHGPRLNRALRWMEGRSDVTNDERDFVLESESAERHRQRKALIISAAVGVLLLMLLIAGAWLLSVTRQARDEARWHRLIALSQRWQVEGQRRLAEQARENERGYQASLLAQIGGREREALSLALTVGSWPQDERPRAAVAQGLVDALSSSHSLRTIEDPRGLPTLMALSPTGDRLALASSAGEAGVWDVASGEPLVAFELDDERLNALSYSPTGDRLALATHAKIELRDPRSGSRIGEPIPLEQELPEMGLAFSPAGELLATAAGTLILAATGEAHGRLSDRRLGGIMLLRWSDDGEELITVDDRRQVMRWDRSGAYIGTLDTLDNMALALDAAGSLVAASVGSAIWLWDRESGAPLRVFGSSEASFGALRFSPDGSRLAGANSEGSAQIWDPRTGDTLAYFDSRDGNLQALAWSPDGQLIATGGFDQAVRLWSPSSTEAVAEFETYPRSAPMIYQLAFSADGRTLVSTSEDGQTQLWGVPTGLPTTRLAGQELSVASFAPDAERTIVAGERRAIRVWSSADGQPLRTLEESASVINDALAWSPDGERIAAAEGRAIGLWEASSGRRLAMLTEHRADVNQLRFSPDGQTLASVSDDGTLRLWDASAGRQLAAGEAGDLPQLSVLWLDGPGELGLASAGEDGLLHLWSAAGVHVEARSGHSAAIRTLARPTGEDALAALTRGNILASASDDASVRIWNLEGDDDPRLLQDPRLDTVFAMCFAGQHLVTAGTSDVLWWAYDPLSMVDQDPLPITEHRDDITGLSCSPTGDLIASADSDGAVELWAVDGAEPQRYVSFQDRAEIRQLLFSPDGAQLLTVSSEGSASTWDTRHQVWVQRGCELLLDSDEDEGLDAASRALCLEQSPAP
ncbi:AAA-like domain-containing protein [Pseudenhygromyxa sp. WMMC2535]|uniref:AAA-like domain-containing protein n=1 Tax=Pseudenhygromyxa sp. WMMC2535 TaxID=2712867 RepID=UPI0015578CEC|nr:AAA-like domain-containing protein [Pseudenhygromyxa sp. WMMC2535]